MRRSLLNVALISLSQRKGDHLESEKKQNNKKRAPAETRSYCRGRFVIHFRLAVFFQSSAYCFLKIAVIELSEPPFLVRRAERRQENVSFFPGFLRLAPDGLRRSHNTEHPTSNAQHRIEGGECSFYSMFVVECSMI
jgi:hypothetical protein